MSTTANLCRLYSCIWTTTGTLDEIHSIDFDLRPVNLTADDLAPSDNPSKMLSYIWKACENGYLDEGDDTQSSSPQTPTVVEHTTIFPSPPPKSSFLSNNWTALDYDEDWAWGDRHFSVVEECMLFFCSGMFNFRTFGIGKTSPAPFAATGCCSGITKKERKKSQLDAFPWEPIDQQNSPAPTTARFA
ncbi:uncharacterized protein EV420DRAFT_1648398 [Desarmillaria tabescens]|uniref:Uncharacterized protein n=1 Tax=Armillaria tabescens TaxID=1929756 RepID=A0AA39MTQ3_ARMTA|nr:uncharacterized protein EV420DRAFT_1648398 [Desarmillaria tabescens]KAK0445684.1 hypothetical protein EV420DRAFT_1648398 [Desarmillaria tabescens]